MNETTISKVTKQHLSRNAYLYVRQSTLRQVFENTESTKRQYQLRQRAIILGWTEEQVITIDEDLGQSGASANDRVGFQRLVAEVSLKRAGIVLGLEVSRLARNCSDWHRLLELCSHTNTLILDEEGVYSPTDFNDRLLLGMKGTMSEAELYMLRSRLRGGAINKARRGQLRTLLPIGFVYDELGQITLDPDLQVQECIQLFFTTFFRLATASATVRYFAKNKLLFPRRVPSGPGKSKISWGPLSEVRACHLLHNPRYAGVYFFGRHRHRTAPDGSVQIEILPRDQWISFIQDAHPGYITWEQFEQNQHILEQTKKAYGQDRRKSPPREGPALLQGKAICAYCGLRMTVSYHSRKQGLVPQYRCYNRGPTATDLPCQVVHGGVVDQAIEKLIIESLQPEALQLSIAVQDELQNRIEQVHRQYKQHVQRAEYEANTARQRYMSVDHNNRLVAASLEKLWNEKLCALEQAQRDYEDRKKTDFLVLDDKAKQRIANLAKELPAIWKDPNTSSRDKKRIVGYLIEDVTLRQSDTIIAQVRFRGGATKTLQLAIPLNAWQKRATDPRVIKLIDKLLEENNDRQIAEKLNEQQIRTGADNPFTPYSIHWIRKRYQLKSLQQRLKERGMLTCDELCRHLRVDRATVSLWRNTGVIKSYKCNGHAWMYEVPDPNILLDPSSNR